MFLVEVNCACLFMEQALVPKSKEIQKLKHRAAQELWKLIQKHPRSWEFPDHRVPDLRGRTILEIFFLCL